MSVILLVIEEQRDNVVEMININFVLFVAIVVHLILHLQDRYYYRLLLSLAVL